MQRLTPCSHHEEMPLPAALMCHFFLISSVLERAGNRQAEQHGLTLPQWLALGSIGQGGAEGITHSELGSRLMLSKAPITGIVDRLERGEYVQRVPDPKDRRVSRIVICDKGEETWQKVRQALRDQATEQVSGLTPDEQETLLGLMARLLDAVSKADPILNTASPS
jgi:DNA-binding MarR family transcriptional regulator